MNTVTATNLRKSLFKVLSRSSRSIPTLVRYKKEAAVIIPYRQYQALVGKRKKGTGSLTPLVKGKILEPLGRKTDDDLMKYMGLKA